MMRLEKLLEMLMKLKNEMFEIKDLLKEDKKMADRSVLTTDTFNDLDEK